MTTSEPNLFVISNDIRSRIGLGGGGDTAALEAELAAAEAARDEAEAKLVGVGVWVDMTAAITAACAGAALSDPDSLKAGLTVTTTTGTFDGVTVPCNQINWTMHNTTNDGYNETLNHVIGTVAALLFPGYNPIDYGIEIVSDLVATGTLNAGLPLIGLMTRPGGATGTSQISGAGWRISTATSVSPIVRFGSTSSTSLTLFNPTTKVPRVIHRRFPYGVPGSSLGMSGATCIASAQTSPGTTFIDDTPTGTAFSALDDLMLVIGQLDSTPAAVSGVKIRWQARVFAIANLKLASMDMGCQAAA